MTFPHDHRHPAVPAPPGAPAPAAAPARIALRFVLALLVAAAFLVVPVTPASAQDPLDCEAHVVDTSGLVDVAAVEAAVARVDPRAVLIVRSYDRVEGGELSATIDELVATCFGDPDTGIRADVIVLGLSVGDRQSDVLIGAGWTAAVPDPDELRNDVMGTRFAEGAYTDGLVAAVEEVALGVEAQLPDAAPSTDDPDGTDTLPADEGAGLGSAPVEPDGDPTDGEPTGGSGDDGPSPLAIGLGALGVGACGAVVGLVGHRRRLDASRRELRAVLDPAIARLGVVRERDARLSVQADDRGPTTEGRTRHALLALVRQVEGGRATVDRAAGLVHQAIPAGADEAGRSAIGQARPRVAELGRALDDHDNELDRLAAFLAHLDHLRVALPAKLALLGAEVAEADALADQRAGEGWAVDPARAELDQVRASLAAVDLDPFELDLLALSDAVEQAESRLFAAAHDLRSLPDRPGSLREWSAGLDQAANAELARVDDLRRRLAEVSTVHAPESWRWAADHPERAVEALEEADELRSEADTVLIPAQRFDEAGRALDRAGMGLIQADRLLDEVDDLLVDLDRARSEAAGIVVAAGRSLEALAAFVDRHRADLEPPLRDRPGELADALRGLDHELTRRHPNHLRVAETGERLGRQVDALLAEAEDQHEAAEARRRELAREIGRAQGAIARARRAVGWELFPSRDGRALDELERVLAHLPSETGAAIEVAADVADDALRIQERIIARRRRGGVWVSTGGGGWSGGSGGWSSGGAGGFGGSSSRSGGGRSFGGGHAGGGRSFGGGRSSGGF